MQRNPLFRGAACWSALLVAALVTPSYAVDGPAFRFTVVDANGSAVPSANVVLLGEEGKTQHLFRIDKETWLIKGVGAKATLTVMHERLGGTVELSAPHYSVGVAEYRIRLLPGNAEAVLLTPAKSAKGAAKKPAAPVKPSPETNFSSRSLADRIQSGPTCAGDDCASAAVVGSLPFSTVGDSCACTDNYDEICPFNEPGSPDAVYAYTPASDECVDITLCNGSSYDTKLYVYENACGGFQSGTEFACNDDACPGFVSELLGLSLTAGNTYYIVVDGYGGDCGDYVLDIATTACPGGPPANDDCVDAEPIAIGGSSSGSTATATADGAPTCGTSNTSPGVWYSVIGDGTTLTADLCQSTFDTKISVFCDGCTNLECVGGNDDSCGLQSEVSWCSEVGVEYLILVHAFSSGTGDYTLNVQSDSLDCADPPACGAVGPTCTADFSVNAPGVWMGNTCGEGDDCGLRPSEDHIYEVNLPNDGIWTFSLCGSAFDTHMSLGTDCCDGVIAVNDDSCGLQSEITMNLTAGTYYVMIEAFGSAGCGDYTLTIDKEPPPPGCAGDDCASADPVGSVPFSSSGNTCDCNDDYDEICPFNTPGSPDKVYAYTPSQDECVDISLCGDSAYDTKLYVYENACGGFQSGTAIACNDDSCSTPSFPSAFVSRVENVNLTGGNTYYIVIDGYDGACGDYTIDITPCGPPCVVECDPGATPENEPNCGLPEDTVNAGCNNPIIPGAIDCCGPNTCTDAACEAAVCACDSFCCGGSWDSACAGPNPFVPGCSAQDLCPECSGAPTFNFSPIACGEEYCGTGAFDGSLRDTDWYEITVASDTQFTWTVEAEFPALIGLVETFPCGSGDCSTATALNPFDTGDDCEVLSVTACLPPGTYWWFVAPLFEDPFPCGAEYTARLDCETCEVPRGACCDDFGGCQEGLAECQCDGTWQGDATTCDPNPCPLPPSNDLCEDAIPVSVPSVTAGDTTLATIDPFPTCVTTVAAPGVWYEVIGTGNTITVSTCNDADYDTKLNVYCPSCADAVCVTGNDDAPGCAGFTSEASWCSEIGQTYLVLVQGFGGATGSFNLTVSDDGLDCPNPASCTLCPGDGDCCEPNGTPGCNDEECCNQVCACDPFCCEVFWDQDCVDGSVGFGVPGCNAEALCQVCAPEPPTGACCDGLACTIETEADCDALGGRYLGDNTSCTGGGAGTPTTYDSGVLDTPIPDGGGPGDPIVHTINVPDSFTVGDVNVALGITHTWVGDLCVTLEHNGTTVELIQRMGTNEPGCHQDGPFGCGEDNLDIILDDQGTGGAINDQCSPNLSSPPNYIPNEALAAFIGMDSAGDWTITISDNADFDSGLLNEWSLTLDLPGGDPCIPTGACCLWPDECEIRTEENCEAARGVYLGDDTICDAVGPVTVYEETVNIPIPDGDPVGTSHTINVPDSIIISDLNVDLVVEHTWVGDLCVSLTHNGTTVDLIQRIGTNEPGCHQDGPFGCGEDNLDIILDDQGGGGAINDQCAPNLSSPPNYVPNNPLSAFNGMDAAGDWILEISDNAGFDTGTLIAWSLHIAQPGPDPCEDAGFTGACCNRTDGSCTDDVLPENCEGAQLVWSKNLACDEVECEEARGACCNGLTGVCTDNVLQGNCVGAQAVWSKDTSCSAVQCEAALGACCDTLTGDCSITTQAECSAEGQEWTKGAGCEDIECEPPFIPTVSAWGMIVMVLLLLVAGKVYFGYRRYAFEGVR